MPARGPVLRVEGLGVRYGALVALEDMAWAAHAGEILGIIGPNGAGKSSCFAAVTGSVAHAGDVFLDGTRVTGVPTWDLAALGLRRTFQQNAFFGELTVLENTMGALISEHSTGLVTSIFAPWKEAASRRRAAAEAARLLTSFGIERAYHDHVPASVPYGVQRLLSVALAYGLGARALLLDEPAAGTGGPDMRRLAQVLVALRARGTAVVVIEHHMDLIMGVADRIVVIDQGRKLAEGAPAEIQKNPAVLEAYLGRAS
jgi:branched-chain amino acid transport system ATP-binding protein